MIGEMVGMTAHGQTHLKIQTPGIPGLIGLIFIYTLQLDIQIAFEPFQTN